MVAFLLVAMNGMTASKGNLESLGTRSAVSQATMALSLLLHLHQRQQLLRQRHPERRRQLARQQLRTRLALTPTDPARRVLLEPALQTS